MNFRKLHLVLAAVLLIAMSAYSLDNSNKQPGNQTGSQKNDQPTTESQSAPTATMSVAHPQEATPSLDEHELPPFRSAAAANVCRNMNEMCGDGQESCCLGLFCKKSVSGDKICLKP